jgi:hypothetical protein
MDLCKVGDGALNIQAHHEMMHYFKMLVMLLQDIYGRPKPLAYYSEHI